MQIHELNNYSGSLSDGAFVAVDNGSDTGKVSVPMILSDAMSAVNEVNDRLDNIITSPAPTEQEIIDARKGAGGVVYSSLGEAIRFQVSEENEAFLNLAKEQIYIQLNNNNILPDPMMKLGRWGQTQGAITVSPKEGSLSNVITYTKTGSSSGTFGIVIPITSLTDGETYRFAFRTIGQHNTIIRIRDNNNGTYGSVNKYLVADANMTNEDNQHFHYYDWTFDASDITSGYSYIQLDIKITISIGDQQSFYEPFFGLASSDTQYSTTLDIGDTDILEPINLFNGDYYSDSYWNGAGVLTSGNNYVCAKPQLLEPGDYVYIINKQYFGSGAANVFKFSDDTKTTMDSMFSATLLEERTINGLTYALYTFNIAIESYIATNIGYGVSDPANYMIVKGTTIADFPESYRYYFEPYKVVKEPTKANESMLEQVIPIYGKKVAVNGDSICAGADGNGGFIKPIAGHNNMDCSNLGVSGGTLAYGTTYPGGDDRHWICSTIQTMPQDCDYYIFEGGVNDYANQVPLGSLTSGYPEKGAQDDDIDNTTVIGAMEYACRDLVTLFPGKKCGFVFVHGIFANSGGYATWHTQYKPGMIAALEKWGVPFIDLENEVPPLNLISSLKAAYTTNGDGWHPTESGYNAFYTDKIKSWMESL